MGGCFSKSSRSARRRARSSAVDSRACDEIPSLPLDDPRRFDRSLTNRFFQLIQSRSGKCRRLRQLLHDCIPSRADLSQTQPVLRLRNLFPNLADILRTSTPARCISCETRSGDRSPSPSDRAENDATPLPRRLPGCCVPGRSFIRLGERVFVGKLHTERRHSALQAFPMFVTSDTVFPNRVAISSRLNTPSMLHSMIFLKVRFV